MTITALVDKIIIMIKIFKFYNENDNDNTMLLTLISCSHNSTEM